MGVNALGAASPGRQSHSDTTLYPSLAILHTKHAGRRQNEFLKRPRPGADYANRTHRPAVPGVPGRGPRSHHRAAPVYLLYIITKEYPFPKENPCIFTARNP